MSLIAEALRAELQRVIAEPGEFDLKTCVQVERMARAAKAVLATAGGAGTAVQTLREHQEGNNGDMLGEGGMNQMTSGLTINPYQPLAPAPASETFGVAAIKELTKILPALLQRNRAAAAPTVSDDPLTLVRAIKEAKDAGLHEVAGALEARLVEPAADPELVEIASEAVEEVLAEDKAARTVLVSGAGLSGGGPFPTPPATAGPLVFVTPGLAPNPLIEPPLTFGED